MARYPDQPAPQGNSQTPYPFKPQRPLARSGPLWAQKTRTLTRFNVLSVDLVYNALTWTQVKTLYDFWQSVGDGAGSFSFADFNGYVAGAQSTVQGVPWSNLFVAKGDGATKDWTLPTYMLQCHETAGLIDNVTVKVAGTVRILSLYPNIAGPDGYVWQGHGLDGLDALHLTAAPVSDALVTVGGVCRRAARIARFAQDEFPFATRNPSNLQGGTITVLEQAA